MEEETHREKDIFFQGEPVGSIRQAGGPGQGILQFVAQQLGVEQLLGIFPLVERFGFVQPFITLETDQLPTSGAGNRFCQLRLAHARRAFGQERLA